MSNRERSPERPARWRVERDPPNGKTLIWEIASEPCYVGYIPKGALAERITREHNALVDLWERCQISSMRARTDWVEEVVGPALGLAPTTEGT